MHHAPYKFTWVRELDQGYDIDVSDPMIWPRYADVHLRAEPLPRGSGLQFMHLPRALPDHRAARLPDWAVHHAELGALHALMVGGPGGLPITDVRIKLVSGGWREIDSGERMFFLAAYLATRKIVHKASQQCPCFLEYVERATFIHGVNDERSVLKELQRRRASGILSRPHESIRGMLWFEADVPVSLAEDLDLALATVDPHFRRPAPEILWEAVGYRSRELTDVPKLLRSFGPPADWPDPGDDDPQLGGVFPELPQRPTDLPERWEASA